MKQILNYINGTFVPGSREKIGVEAPLSGTIEAEVKLSTSADLDEALNQIEEARKKWAALTFKRRAEVIFNFRDELAKHEQELIEIIIGENGKAEAEARAEVLKAIELCEFAVSVPSLISGRTQFVSTGIEVREIIQPLGIVASITPFNFPLMVPMWTIPNILVTGNAMILKPSEKTPETALILARLLKNAGLPDGILNVIQGDREMVEAICDHPRINCVTFVGSTPVAKAVYRRATHELKRCLALGGAKNHIIVTDEVDPKVTAKEILSAAYGMSGQRCMAASVVLIVGKGSALIEELVIQSRQVQLGKTMNPLISAEAVQSAKQFLHDTKGQILVDGRTFENYGDPHGFYIGPSVVLCSSYDEVTEQEVFAPTLEIVQCETLNEALEYQARSPYANGASIFTDIGEASSIAAQTLTSGMIGVNIGVPVPRDPFSFGGLKQSKFGVGDITGYNSIPLFTVNKKVTTKWNQKFKKDWMS